MDKKSKIITVTQEFVDSRFLIRDKNAQAPIGSELECPGCSRKFQKKHNKQFFCKQTKGSYCHNKLHVFSTKIGKKINLTGSTMRTYSDRELSIMVDFSLTAKEAALKANTTLAIVYQYRNKEKERLGIVKRKFLWTKEAEQTLLSLFEQNYNSPQIGKMMGIPTNIVSSKFSDLRTKMQFKPRIWTKEEDLALIEYKKTNRMNSAFSEKYNRSLPDISKRYFWLQNSSKKLKKEQDEKAIMIKELNTKTYLESTNKRIVQDKIWEHCGGGFDRALVLAGPIPTDYILELKKRVLTKDSVITSYEEKKINFTAQKCFKLPNVIYNFGDIRNAVPEKFIDLDFMAKWPTLKETIYILFFKQKHRFPTEKKVLNFTISWFYEKFDNISYLIEHGISTLFDFKITLKEIVETENFKEYVIISENKNYSIKFFLYKDGSPMINMSIKYY